MTVEQMQTTTGLLTSIDVGNMDRDAAERFAAKVNGKTYMKFEAIVAPCGGSCAVSVQSSYEADADEILGMFIFTLATELGKA